MDDLPPMLGSAGPRWPPHWAGALGMVAVYLTISLVLGVVMGLAGVVLKVAAGIELPPLGTQAAGMTLAMLAVLPLVPPLLGVPWHGAVRNAGGPGRRRVWLPVMALFIAGYPLVTFIAQLTHVVLPMPGFLAELFDRLFASNDEHLARLVMFVILAPLAEEFLCRGWLLPAAAARWGPWPAVALTSLVFAGMHLNPWQFFYAAWMGLLLGWVWLRTRSVWPCVLGHAVNNTMAWIISVWTPDAPGFRQESYADEVELLPAWLLALSIAATAGAAVWFRRASAADGGATAPLDPSSPPASRA